MYYPSRVDLRRAPVCVEDPDQQATVRGPVTSRRPMEHLFPTSGDRLTEEVGVLPVLVCISRGTRSRRDLGGEGGQRGRFEYAWSSGKSSATAAGKPVTPRRCADFSSVSANWSRSQPSFIEMPDEDRPFLAGAWGAYRLHSRGRRDLVMTGNHEMRCKQSSLLRGGSEHRLADSSEPLRGHRWRAAQLCADDVVWCVAAST